jgi:hypothetical protein
VQVKDEKQLRQFVAAAKKSYFVQEQFDTAFKFLKRTGAIRKVGRVLVWRDVKMSAKDVGIVAKHLK